MQINKYQLYQGHHYYIWQLNDPSDINGGGQWVPRLNPNSWAMSGDDRYEIQEQVENAMNGIGTYPYGWNQN